MAAAAEALDLTVGTGRDAFGLLSSAGRSLLSLAGSDLQPRSLACPAGGTLVIEGTGSADPLASMVLFNATGCRTSDATTLTGNLAVRPVTVDASRTESFGLVARDFSLVFDSRKFTFSGDLQETTSRSARISSTSRTGAQLALGLAGGRAVTFKSYQHGTGTPIVGSNQVSLQATVETRNPRLGPGLWSFRVTTPEAFTSQGGDLAVAGQGSQLLLSTTDFHVGAGGDPGYAYSATDRAFTLTADTNGDGANELTTNHLTVPDLQSLL